MVDRSRWLGLACLWFACAAAWACAATAAAADDMACLSPTEATAENLYARLQEQAFAALDRRDADLAALKTPAELRGRRADRWKQLADDDKRARIRAVLTLADDAGLPSPQAESGSLRTTRKAGSPGTAPRPDSTLVHHRQTCFTVC